MRVAKLISYIVLVVLVAVTIIVASSSYKGTTSVDNIISGTTTVTTPNELEKIVEEDEPVTLGVFLSSEKKEYEEAVDAFSAHYPDCVIIDGYDEDEESQLERIEEFTDKYKESGAFVVEPVSYNIVDDIAEMAEATKTYWSSVGQNANDLYPMDYVYYTMFQGIDEKQAGIAVTEVMMERLASSNTNELFILDSGVASEYLQRQSGLYVALENRIDVVASERATVDGRSAAKSKVLQWLNQYDEAKAVWTDNEELAMGAADAAKQAGKELVITGIELTDESEEYVKNGEITASIYRRGSEQLLYGMLVPYKAAIGYLDVASMDIDERYFNVVPITVNAANIRYTTDVDLQHIFKEGIENVSKIEIQK